MRVCFYGTDEEITRVCKRPILAVLGTGHAQPVLAFELFNIEVSADPYQTTFRLSADLSEVERGERD
ncbi:hypothetical protein OIE13_03390 [Streptosporangium sp. NBC_01810]|uniref:hypothetical protein n=1 Tax=Streptosporangium sp. NBC_01810 TaxID=2975951 RepID=UPI002DDB875E|nr:hypothetical protein [Streptosporangium sp. NBC_01810]WSA26953.1 hypothetical protein OIE13_03390 [Streptosporangium sp. NBC_01810]